jgi:hypothetical protein
MIPRLIVQATLKSYLGIGRVLAAIDKKNKEARPLPLKNKFVPVEKVKTLKGA